MTTQHVADGVAVWWAAEYVVICEANPAQRGEFERRFRHALRAKDFPRVGRTTREGKPMSAE